MKVSPLKGLAGCALPMLAAVALAACGSAESAESKRQHCADMTDKAEHDACVAELREEEGRDDAKSARDGEIEEACELDNNAHQAACEAGYRRGLVAADEETMGYACEEFESSTDVMLLSACTLGFQQAQEAKRHSEEVSAEEEPGGPVADVGTISVSDGEGTAFRNHFKIGPLIYPDEGMPPDEVLEACNLQYQGILEKSVFARGEISVSYTEGSFPEYLGIDAEGIVQGTGAAADVVAYQRNGEWLCRQEELASTSYEIQPGETWTMPIWYIAEDILNNAQPRVSPEVKNGWQFKFIGPAMAGTWKYSGAGAGECAGYDELYLYNRSGTCEES